MTAKPTPRYYVILGRANGWDEDSAFFYRCASEEKAVRLASTEIANLAGRPYRKDDDGIYINQVLVSDTPIKANA